MIEQTFAGARSGEILGVSRDLEITLRAHHARVWRMADADLVPRERVSATNLVTANVPE